MTRQQRGQWTSREIRLLFRALMVGGLMVQRAPWTGRNEIVPSEIQQIHVRRHGMKPAPTNRKRQHLAYVCRICSGQSQPGPRPGPLAPWPPVAYHSLVEMDVQAVAHSTCSGVGTADPLSAGTLQAARVALAMAVGWRRHIGRQSANITTKPQSAPRTAKKPAAAPDLLSLWALWLCGEHMVAGTEFGRDRDA